MLTPAQTFIDRATPLPVAGRSCEGVFVGVAKEIVSLSVEAMIELNSSSRHDFFQREGSIRLQQRLRMSWRPWALERNRCARCGVYIRPELRRVGPLVERLILLRCCIGASFLVVR